MKKIVAILMIMFVGMASYSQIVAPMYFNSVERVDRLGEVWVDNSPYTVELVARSTLNIHRGLEYVQYSIIEPSIEIGYYGDIEYTSTTIINTNNYSISTIIVTDNNIVLIEGEYTYTFYNK